MANLGLEERGLVQGEDGRIRPEWAASNPELRDYYDYEWGKAPADEHDLYERLCLEGFQSGLSWSTVLKKRAAFREVFANFDPDIVATYDDADVECLLQDARIIRNRRKIKAVIVNARATVALRDSYPGGLWELVLSHVPDPDLLKQPESAADIATTSPESVALAKALKKYGFSFVGPKTCYALMQALGLVNDRVVGASPLIQ